MVPIRECVPAVNGQCVHKNERKGKFFQKLGPGFVTGASDDDPSGLTTYAQSGAQFGPKIFWLALWTLPLMVSVQEMAGRISLMTQGGLTQALLKKIPRLLVAGMVCCLVIANTINIGADIAGMAESVEMTVGIPFYLSAAVLTLGMLLLQIFMPYKRYVNVLKWCTLSLFSYVIAAFMLKPGWLDAIKNLLIPSFEFYNNNFWYILTAVLGTTISPYLLFWQASQEQEEKKMRDEKRQFTSYAVSQCEMSSMREETFIGMLFSNAIMFFVMLVSAAVLFSSSKASAINSMVDAAKALEPLAGAKAAWLFAFGIIGTGLLTVPVLAGASAYAMAEFFGWQKGLHLKWREARGFYGVIAASTIIGLLLNATHFNAVDFLIWSAIVNACVTPIILVGMIFVANDEKIIGKFKNSKLAACGAWVTVIVFCASIVGFLVTYKWV